MSTSHKNAPPRLRVTRSWFYEMAQIVRVGNRASVLARPRAVEHTVNSTDLHFGIGGTNSFPICSLHFDGKISVAFKPDSKILAGRSADDKSRSFNESKLLSFSGSMGSETCMILDTQPVASTVAIDTTPPGAYPITFSSRSNGHYEFTSVDS